LGAINDRHPSGKKKRKKKEKKKKKKKKKNFTAPDSTDLWQKKKTLDCSDETVFRPLCDRAVVQGVSKGRSNRQSKFS